MKTTEGIARKEWACKHQDCRKKITKGQKYYLWHLNGDALRQHADHGEPVVKTATKKAATKAKATKKEAAVKVTTKKGGKK